MYQPELWGKFLPGGYFRRSLGNAFLDDRKAYTKNSLRDKDLGYVNNLHIWGPFYQTRVILQLVPINSNVDLEEQFSSQKETLLFFSQNMEDRLYTVESILFRRGDHPISGIVGGRNERGSSPQRLTPVQYCIIWVKSRVQYMITRVWYRGVAPLHSNDTVLLLPLLLLISLHRIIWHWSTKIFTVPKTGKRRVELFRILLSY